MVATTLYLVYIAQNEFKLNELLEGSVTAVFFILGDVFRSMAFRYGPGGPINALVGTQVIYQTLLNALFFSQALTAFQYYGITAGVLATVVISTGDEILDCLKCHKNVTVEDTQKEDHKAWLLADTNKSPDAANELK